eukprot:1154156-Pelagomonas_calceolata.AAC.2
MPVSWKVTVQGPQAKQPNSAEGVPFNPFIAGALRHFDQWIFPYKAAVGSDFFSWQITSCAFVMMHTISER